MTRAEEIALNERNKERNLRYIRAKIVHANAEEMALLKGFVHGLGIVGWDDAEYNRPIQKKEQEVVV